MPHDPWMGRRAMVLAGGAALVALPIRRALAEGATWTAATEYPATAMPGVGLASLARFLAASSGGRIVVQPGYDAPGGLRSATIPAAVQGGTLVVGDAFAGALDGLDPVFQLSSLPFGATNAAEARRLYDAARPQYASVFAARGQRLLYATPWPPSGIWCRNPVRTAADLKGLAIRTYDSASTSVFAGAGAAPVQLSFADAMTRLKDGSLAAVLSSGDGGAGRRLWDELPHFTAIGYAMPLSFTTVNTATYQALRPDLQQAVDQAAAQTEAAQWALLGEREAANQTAMRAHGMTIDMPDATLDSDLRQAAVETVAAWVKLAGPDKAAVLKH
ncbi:TRAP transporter substrate-binding protein [Acidisphaera sp. L21]|uniref:TRAP transporter substrate-binding protein n=1 Tax=Acidisphaera sp. L21 TaxID=1641851 RepID=UPI00131CF521|nr:TRAP transporter substrate-binding protein [Acidisphaera sp. L21]